MTRTGVSNSFEPDFPHVASRPQYDGLNAVTVNQTIHLAIAGRGAPRTLRQPSSN
jgi:hypothetical protein